MDFLKKYFNGELTADEEQQVQKWLAEHGDEPRVIACLDAILDEVQSENKAVSSEAFTKVSVKLGLDRRTSVRKVFKKASRWFAGIAAGILLPLSGAIAFKYLAPAAETEWLELKVPSGQNSELTLSDGTHLHLNAGTRITYPSEFIGKERRIFVEGEIFADVAKDSERPFFIVSGDVDVKVLGTTFNLKAYDNTECVELLLLEGAVEMDIDAGNHTKEFVMEHGEMVQYDRKSGEIEMRNFNPGQYKGFHENRSIHFFNLRLSDIVSDLERIFGTKIILLDESLADTRYFAWFTNNEDLDQILQGINIDGKMKFSRRNEVVYISK